MASEAAGSSKDKLHGDKRKGSKGSKGKHEEPEPKKAKVDDGDDESDMFQGPIIHSSQLDAPGAPSFKEKTVAVVGGGASAVEAVETALAQGAKKCIMCVRDDKASC